MPRDIWDDALVIYCCWRRRLSFFSLSMLDWFLISRARLLFIRLLIWACLLVLLPAMLSLAIVLCGVGPLEPLS